MHKTLIVLIICGCALSEGDQCTVDSDCRSGLICNFERICQAPENFGQDIVEPPETTVSDTNLTKDTNITLDCETGSSTDTSNECSNKNKAFLPSCAPCAEPTNTYLVTSLTIADKDNGLAQLAPLANGVIQGGFSNGSVNMSLAVDGSASSSDPDCLPDIAWILEDEWRNSDCTPIYSDTFPLALPGLGPEQGVATFMIYDAKYDLQTQVIRGYVEPEEIRDAVDKSLESAVSDSAFVFDTDTNGDGQPDKPSVVVGVGLQQ